MTAYRLSLSLSVDDPERLWAAAATLAMGMPGMTGESVVDTIGPREAPGLADCLALLLAPERFAGCAIETMAIEAIPGAKPPVGAIGEPMRCAFDHGERMIRPVDRARRASCSLPGRTADEFAQR